MFRSRQYVVFFLLLSFLIFLFIRLFWLQIINYDRFSKLAAEQHNRVLKIEPARGNMLDRGLDPLTTNLDVPSIYCDPQEVKQKVITSNILSEVLELNRKELLDKFSKDKLFAWIKRRVDSKTAEKIKKLNLPGIYFTNESKRHYSNDNMAAHIIGFVNVDNEGLEGLELLYNEELKGKPGWRHLIKDARKKTVLFKEEDSIPPQNGLNIVLTIDNVIQYIVEDELEKMVEKFHASSASIIVMNPSSGAILALANYPNYDLNNFSSVQQETKKNIAVSNVYEPGSAFKIVTASAVLNEGLFDLDDRFFCEKGEYKTCGRVLHDIHPYGELPFREVIAKSSNIGTVKIAQRLGKEKLYEYIQRFGFNEKTGIDLPGEVSGISRPPLIWSKSDITTIPIGQGIAVTPIQLACAISAIANGGYLMKPYIVERITTWEGITHKKFGPVTRRKILDEKTCKNMKDALREVVLSGTGKPAFSKRYETCGKTGTGQIATPGGGYYLDRHTATFIGFAPVDKPLISVIVTAKEPHPIYYGGSVAAPTFKRIVERSLQYLDKATVGTGVL